MPTQGLCVQLQQALTEVAGSQAPSIKRDRVGYLEALQSSANLSGVRRVAVPSDGKRKQVELIYLQRGLASSASIAQPSNFCDATDTPEARSFTVEVDNWLHRKLRFTEDDLRQYCYSDDAVFVANAIMAELNALTVRMNQRLIGLQSVNFGQFLDNSTSKVIDWLDINNAPNYYEESRLLEEYSLIGGSGRPLVVGAGDLAHYTRMTGKGCCNPYGIDLSQAGEFAFFYDRFVNGILPQPNDHYIVMAPGAVQLITWNANVGDYARIDGRDEAGTLVDPFTGLRFDVDQVWDSCTKRYNITISINYGIVFLPVDAFSVGDELEGVNYSLHFRRN